MTNRPAPPPTTWWTPSAAHFGIKKVGHCGTLDPNATGLLIIVLGRGTKLSEKLMSDDKVYEGTIKFGETTDSYDADGELVASLPVPPMTLEELNEAAAAFQGDQMQTPPMVSAVKIKGVPLYKMARKGIEVEREARLIHVYNFRFTSYDEPLGLFPRRLHQGHLRPRPGPRTGRRNSAAARIWPPCAASSPANSTSRTPSPLKTC